LGKAKIPSMDDGILNCGFIKKKLIKISIAKKHAYRLSENAI